jgi:predicted metal-binding membrane protein
VTEAGLRTTAGVTATAALAAGCWVVTVRRMSGMDAGVATELGSLASFVGIWVPMMAAMMLPAALPALTAFVRADRRPLAAPRFVGSYLGVWAVFGLAAYALYQRHSHAAAGAVTIAAGLYELTPLKRGCRRRCRRRPRSGLEFGVNCLGSSVGLMAVLLALGVMSLVWTAVIAGVVLAQKLLPPRAPVDLLVAFGLVALGILVARGIVPG